MFKRGASLFCAVLGLVGASVGSNLDSSFGSGAGANGPVRALAVLADDSVLAGGEFTTFNGQPRAGIARTLPDGELDAGFVVSTQLLSSVSCIAVQGDGRILLGATNAGPGGAFLVRVNADGSTDESFAATVNGPVQAIALGTNGSIWLGGDLTEVNGMARNRIVRLNSNGVVDAGFDAGTGPNGKVLALLPAQDGAMIVGGQFTAFSALERGCVVKLQADGTVDTNFNPRVGYSFISYRFEPHYYVRCLAMQADGTILIGGRLFVPAIGAREGALSRLFPDGQVDAQFNGAGGAQLREVFAMAVETSGRIVVGGSFQGHEDINRPYLLRVDAAGHLDDCLIASTNESPNGPVFALAKQSGDRLVAGGAFTQVAGMARSRLARFQGGEPPEQAPEVTLKPVFGWPRARPGETTWVDAIIKNCQGKLGIQWYRDGEVILGMRSSRLSVGHFPYPAPGNYFAVVSNAVGMTTSSVVRVEFGGVDAGFNTTNGPSSWQEPNIYDAVLSVLPLRDKGQVLVGGRFLRVEETNWAHLARLNADGSLDRTYTTRPNRPVYTMLEQPDGRVIIGGEFNAVNGQFRDRVARLEADGSLDTNFQTRLGLNGIVRSMALQPDGKVILGGVFSIPLPGGGYLYHVARLETNGAVDFSFNAGTNFFALNTASNFVRAVLLLPGGKILVGGGFHRAAGSTRDFLARLLPDGEIDPVYGRRSLIDVDGPIHCLAPAPGGLIYASGAFTNVNSVKMTNIVRLLPDGSLDESFRPLPPGSNPFFPGTLNALSVDPAGRAWAVQSAWQSVYDVNYVESRIVRYLSDGTIQTNYTSPVLTRAQIGGAGIHSIVTLPDGRAFIGGNFEIVDRFARENVALLLPDLAGPPSFLTSPKSIMVEGGQAFVLSGSTTLSSPTEFQWFQNGSTLLDATNAFLCQMVSDPLMNGEYWLVASNQFGVSTSAVATVTVRPAGRPGSVVRSFIATPGPTSGGVIALAESADGKVFVGGSFSNYHGIARAGTARVEADGAVDVSYSPNETSQSWAFTSALLPLADGSVIVAGEPNYSGGSSPLAIQVRRYQANGAFDTGWKFDASLSPYSPILSSHGSRYRVSDLAADGQGRIYLGGGFSGVRMRNGSSFPIRYAMRLFEDGTADTTYQVRLPGSGPSPAILAMSLDVNGDVLLGTHPIDDQFGMYRLNSLGRDDGTPRFGVGNGIDVWSIVTAPDGRVIFTCDPWSPATNLLYGLGRRLPNGQFDPSFRASPLPDRDQYDRVLGVQRDGRILVTVLNYDSSFPSGLMPWRTPLSDAFGYGERLSTNRLVRLNPDGSLDATFDIGDGPNGFIGSALVRSDGNILVGGRFTRFSGYFCNNIALLHGGSPQPPSVLQPAELKTVVAGDVLHLSALVEGLPPPQLQWLRNGSPIPDATRQLFQLRSVGWEDAGVYSLVASNASGVSTSIVATVSVQAGRLDSDWVDSGFSAGSEPDGEIHVIVPQADGRVLIGGQFTRVGGVPRPGIARLLADGRLDESFVPSPDFSTPSFDRLITVSRIVVMPDGKVAISRTFTTFNFTVQNDMIRLHEDGRLDTSFTNQLYRIPLLAMPDGRLLIGRGLQMLAADGTVDGSFVVTNISASISQASLLADGRILVSAEGNGIIERLMPDGARDVSFDRSELGLNSGSSSDICFPAAGGAVPGAQILAQTVQPDGKVIIGGVFSKYMNRYTANLLRLLPSGRIDPGFGAWTQTDYAIRAIAVQPDGKILIGGCFTNVGTYPSMVGRLHLARLHPDGSVDAAFDPAPTFRGSSGGYVQAMALQPDGRLLIGGSFDSVNGATRRNLARLNGDLTLFQTVTAASGFTTQIKTVRGRTYWLERRDSLDGANWTAVQSFTGDGNVLTLSDTAIPAVQRFYRVRAE